MPGRGTRAYLAYLFLEFPLPFIAFVVAVYAILGVVLLLLFLVTGLGVIYEGISVAASAVYGDGSAVSIAPLTGAIGSVIGAIRSFTHGILSGLSGAAVNTRALPGATLFSAITIAIYLWARPSLEGQGPPGIPRFLCTGLYSYALYIAWLPVISSFPPTNVVLYVWLVTVLTTTLGIAAARKTSSDTACAIAFWAFMLLGFLPLFWVATSAEDPDVPAVVIYYFIYGAVNMLYLVFDLDKD